MKNSGSAGFTSMENFSVDVDVVEVSASTVVKVDKNLQSVLVGHTTDTYQCNY